LNHSTDFTQVFCKTPTNSLQPWYIARPFIYYIYQDIFQKSSKVSKNSFFQHFFAHIYGTNCPILLIFELSLTNYISNTQSESHQVRLNFTQVMVVTPLNLPTNRWRSQRWASNSRCYIGRVNWWYHVLRTGLKNNFTSN